MSEQLSMFASGASPDVPQAEFLETNIPAEPEYEALDYQLADLMVELNDFVPDDEQAKKALNKTLRHCTLEISKSTREGQIAFEISTEQSTLIMQTTVVGEAGEYMPLIVDAGVDKIYLYLNRYWQYQQRLADQIKARIESIESLSKEQQAWVQSRLADYFSDDDSTETNWQKRAAELALENRFLIVSGGPGTGKTTTITRTLALLIEQRLQSSSNDQNEKTPKKVGGVLRQTQQPITSTNNNQLSDLKILLAAPTGKAAIRMLDSIREVSQSLQSELSLDENVLAQMPTHASTIHKLLGYKPNSAQFKHNRDNPLRADVVLVDEASMIDIALMSKLVDAVPEHAKLILIGDKDQLASVETGSVFADICAGLEDSENFSASLVTLKKNWRFAAHGDIGQCAIAANQGDSNSLLDVLNDASRTDAELIPPANMRDAELIKPWNNYFAAVNNPESSLQEIFAAFNQYRVLCALRRGLNGSQTMTSRIETALEKQDLITRRRSANLQQSSWYHGRPIMITQNSYSRGLFNGDTGITLIRDGEIKVFFMTAEGSFPDEGSSETDVGGSEFQSFSPVRLPAHETTWAMTIHKSQGSEFDQVVLILPQEEMPLLTRQLVYTGITRAKETVSLVASEDVLVAGVKAEVVKATRIASLVSPGDKEVVD